jgi:hypothetical protein
VCGWNEDEAATPCAQTQSFTTGKPVEDSATGSWFTGTAADGSVDARSGPAGQNPHGDVWKIDRRIPTVFHGFVTCLVVHGNRAAVGAVGHESNDPVAGTQHPATLLVTIEDNGASGSDTWHDVLQQGSTPPACAGASFANQMSLSYSLNEIVVNDAP